MALLAAHPRQRIARRDRRAEHLDACGKRMRDGHSVSVIMVAVAVVVLLVMRWLCCVAVTAVEAVLAAHPCTAVVLLMLRHGRSCARGVPCSHAIGQLRRADHLHGGNGLRDASGNLGRLGACCWTATGLHATVAHREPSMNALGWKGQRRR